MTKEDVLKREINQLQARIARQAVRMVRIHKIVDAALAGRTYPFDALQLIDAVLKEEYEVAA